MVTTSREPSHEPVSFAAIRDQLATEADSSSSSATPEITDEHHLFDHAAVFPTAVEYQVPSLQHLSARKFAAAAERGWDDKVFASAVSYVYNSTPDDAKELRNIVVHALNQYGTLTKKPEIEVAICQINTLAYQLWKLKS